MGRLAIWRRRGRRFRKARALPSFCHPITASGCVGTFGESRPRPAKGQRPPLALCGLPAARRTAAVISRSIQIDEEKTPLRGAPSRDTGVSSEMQKVTTISTRGPDDWTAAHRRAPSRRSALGAAVVTLLPALLSRPASAIAAEPVRILYDVFENPPLINGNGTAIDPVKPGLTIEVCARPVNAPISRSRYLARHGSAGSICSRPARRTPSLPRAMSRSACVLASTRSRTDVRTRVGNYSISPTVCMSARGRALAGMARR